MMLNLSLIYNGRERTSKQNPESSLSRNFDLLSRKFDLLSHKSKFRDTKSKFRDNKCRKLTRGQWLQTVDRLGGIHVADRIRRSTAIRMKLNATVPVHLAAWVATHSLRIDRWLIVYRPTVSRNTSCIISWPIGNILEYTDDYILISDQGIAIP